MTADAGLRAVVSGRVQGVGFRYFVRQRAVALGLRGYVRNQADGGVEVCAAGPPDALAELAADLRLGPPGSVVRGCVVEASDAAGAMAGFTIRS